VTSVFLNFKALNYVLSRNLGNDYSVTLGREAKSIVDDFLVIRTITM
jgi:hypothetical protein